MTIALQLIKSHQGSGRKGRVKIDSQGDEGRAVKQAKREMSPISKARTS